MHRFMQKLLSRGGMVATVLLIVSIFSFQTAYARTNAPAHTAGFSSSVAGPSIATSCVSPDGAAANRTVTYVAYITSDHHIHLHDVTNGRDYQSTQTSSATPSIACASSSGGIFVAWKANDSSNNLWGGEFECNVICNIDPANTLGPATDAAPAVATNSAGSNQYVAWVGTDSQHHLNVEPYFGSLDPHNSSFSTMLTDYTRSGAGVSIAYDAALGAPWLSWVASSGTPYLYVGRWKGDSVLIDYPRSVDSSPYHAGIVASNSAIALIWKGVTSNTIFTGGWNSGSWSQSIGQADTTNYAPALAANQSASVFTSFTGTNTVVYYDVNAYSY